MSKLRSVNTHFWDDNYIIDLDPIEKLLFLYLLTNSNTNMLGIYELHERKIAFDTGIDKEMVLKIFGRFESNGRATLCNGYVILHNHLKHQNFNANMGISAISSFNELPEPIKNKALDIGIVSLLKTICKPLSKGSEPIIKGLKPIGKIEVESEYESEVEDEGEESDPQFSENSKPYQLSQYLLGKILEFQPTHAFSHSPPDLHKWSEDADRMHRLDKRDYKDCARIVKWVFDYFQPKDDFDWRDNVQSIKKLRKHYDKLESQMNKTVPNYEKRQSDVTDYFDRLNRESDVGVGSEQYEVT